MRKQDQGGAASVETCDRLTWRLTQHSSERAVQRCELNPRSWTVVKKFHANRIRYPTDYALELRLDPIRIVVPGVVSMSVCSSSTAEARTSTCRGSSQSRRCRGSCLYVTCFASQHVCQGTVRIRASHPDCVDRCGVQLDWPAASSECYQQSVCDHLRVHRVAYRPTDDAARLQIHDGGGGQLAFGGPDVGKVCDPFLIRCIGFKLTLQLIACDPMGDRGL